MKFSLPVDALRRALEIVIGVVDKTNALPITSNVLLAVENNKLSVTATNLQVEMTAHSSLTYELPNFQCTLPGTKLYEICSKISGENLLECDFDTDGTVFNFTSGKFSGSLSLLPVESFPLMENAIAEESLAFSMETTTLYKLMDKAHYAMAQQDVRYYLNGLFFDGTEQNNALTAVGTDGHRLAVHSVFEGFDLKCVGKCIVPRRGVLELMRLLARKPSNQVEFTANASNLSVKVGNVRFYCKLVEGEYPNYRAAIPTDVGNKAEMETEELIRAVERTLTLCNEKPRGMRLSFETDRLILHSNNSLGEKAHDEVYSSYVGVNCTIGFNADYLLSSLRKVNTKKVRLSFMDSSESVKVEEIEGDASIAVIMPMKV